MGNWRQIAALPTTRYQAAATFHAGKVYVFGGRAENSPFVSTFTTTTYIYDPAGNTWTTGAPLPGAAFCYAFSTASDGVHLVYPASGAHYAYDPNTNTWATRTSVPVVTRFDAHHFVDTTGRFYLAGGRASGGNATAVHRYDPTTDSWTARTAMPTWAANYDPVASPGALGADNKVYLGSSGARRLLAYDTAADSWATTADMPDATAVQGVGVSRLPSGTVIVLPHATFPPGTTDARHLARVDGYDTGSALWSMGVVPNFPGSSYETAVATEPGGVVYLLGGVFLNGSGASVATSAAYAYKQNDPPTVATLLTLTGGVLVSTAAKNRARHQFNDPNSGDSQSKFDWRYRIVGDPTWITGTEVTPNPWHDIDAGTLDPGNYERQVLPYDAAGEPAPAWTPSGFFTAADPPAGPAITYPINGQILDQIEYVEWSIPAQDSYQVRRVADDGAGNPDTGTVYFDTGEVVDTLARKIPLTFTVNSRTEHVQVRIKSGGLWSDWDSVSGAVSFTPPPTPSFTVYPDPSTGSLLVMISTPDPAPGDPAAVSVNVYITEPLPNGQVVEERRATELPITTGWRYWPVVGGWEYDGGRIRVESVAANGTTASST